MALCRFTPRKKALLLVRRSFSSSSSSDRPFPPFPPPPPRPSDDPNAPPRPGPNPGEGPNTAAAASLFQGIRERLQSSPMPPPPRRIPITPPRPPGQQTAPPSIQDIRRTLESFRDSRSAATGSSHPSSSAVGAPPSFQDLLRKSAAPAAPQGLNVGGARPFNFDFIRDSLHKAGSPQQQQQRSPRSRTSHLTSLPQNIFGKELRERDGKPQDVLGKEDEDSGITLMKDYSYEELGKRLVELRPAGAGKDGKEWFSLEELQGRISKLAELEKNEEDPRFGGQYASLRKSLMNIKKDGVMKKNTMQGMMTITNIIGQATPEYLHHPPQEELLERYFHPDHMSSEEKMKLELQRVREEFKMSENDCGSARVQIAQLTLKIKHLSSVLHKKDKHSRKGLQDMVQRRKKYLKYLRRTDWDSYCLVLSKLGLRDVPEYKAPDYKKTQPTTKAKSKKSKSKKKRKMKA